MNLVHFELERFKKNCLEISFCLSKSFVDPVPITGQVILSTTLLSFLHSMVSNILYGKRIGFITLTENKISSTKTVDCYYYQRECLE